MFDDTAVSPPPSPPAHLPEGEGSCSHQLQPRLTASLLCADVLNLGTDLAALQQAGVDYLHVDMADGHFVPLLGIGIEEAKSVRQATQLPFDVHLLVSNPNVWVPRVLDELRPAIVTFQAEATSHGYLLAQMIRQHGALAGVGLNPGTPLSAVEYLLPAVDVVLLMTTNPGFTRQKLIPSMIDKIADLRRLARGKGLDTHISVDGNVSFQNAPRMVAAGADLLVCGSSSVFDRSRGGIVAATTAFRDALVQSGDVQPHRSLAPLPVEEQGVRVGDTETASAEIVTIDNAPADGTRSVPATYASNATQVVAEIRTVLERVNADEVEHLVGDLLAARRVFIHAVGRVLLSLECFGKRLNHLGIECHVVGAMDEPPIGPDDLMLIASGSGESKLPAEIARIAKSKGARLALVTSAGESTIKTLSDTVVHLPCPTKKEPKRGVPSIQLMSTLFDQALHLFGDAVAMLLQDRKRLAADDLWQRHANLE
jgi:ribulose-phosphate 3-epimerase